MNKYETIAKQVLRDTEQQLEHNVIIKHWKSNRPFSGRAWSKTYTIQVPEPKSDISLNTYLHELGHLIYQVKPSCLNEYLACKFALDTMRQYGLSISRKVKRHHNWYIAYCLAQALNRKLKKIPVELKPFRKYLSWKNNRYYADIRKC